MKGYIRDCRSKSGFTGVYSCVSLVLLLFSVCVCGIVSVSYYYFYSLQDIASKDYEDRVKIALELELRRQEHILEDLTYWDEAYEKTIVNPDSEWVDDYTGEYLFKKFGYEFTLAARSGVDATYIATAENAPDLDFYNLRKAGLDTLFERSRKNESFYRVESGVLVLEDGLYLVSLGPFIDEDKELVRPDYSFLVLGQRLDTEFIDEIAKRFKLPGLKLVKSESHESCIALPGVPGADLGYIVWDESLVACDSLAGLGYLSIGFFLITALLTGLVLIRHNRSRRCYEDKLRLAAERAESQSREKSAFMAAMSHDLSSPVHGTIGVLEQLRMETLTDQQLDLVKSAIGSSRRMKNMLVDFLDLSRSEFAELTIVHEKFSLKESMAAVRDMFEVAASRKRVCFSYTSASELPDILLGDEHKLVRILSNLVDNSLKNVPSGGSVQIEVWPVRRELNKLHLLFLVRDDGSGMSDENMVHLFENKGQGGENKQSGKRGLGITIVRWFTLRMGGTACMQTEEGVGSEFAVCLPFEVAEQE